MILYFSATGNSKYVAEKIAEALGDRSLSITEASKAGRYSFSVEKGEMLGIISPTYFWGLPSIVREFLQKLELITEEIPYTYFIATYGTTTGQIGAFVNEYMQKKGYPITAGYSVKMPDTWTPTFDLSDPEKVKAINASAKLQVEALIKDIKKRTKGDFIRHKVPKLAVKIYYPFYEKKRLTSNLTLENFCIGCGLCEKNCPVGAIQMENRRPVWVKERCALCLGCLHRCPEFAIQYGENTRKHGQYIHEEVTL